jgi:hypothetical protein
VIRSDSGVAHRLSLSARVLSAVVSQVKAKRECKKRLWRLRNRHAHEFQSRSDRAPGALSVSIESKRGSRFLIWRVFLMRTGSHPGSGPGQAFACRRAGARKAMNPARLAHCPLPPAFEQPAQDQPNLNITRVIYVRLALIEVMAVPSCRGGGAERGSETARFEDAPSPAQSSASSSSSLSSPA